LAAKLRSFLNLRQFEDTPKPDTMKPFAVRKLTRIVMTNRIALSACALAALILATACEPIRRTHGYAPRPGQLAEIKVGTDGKADVAGKIGRPTTVGAFDTNEWYYISRSTESRAFLQPRVTSQEVIVVAFTDDGIAESVDQYGLEDGRVVNLVTNTTPTRGKRLTFLQQLLGNVGRFTGEQGL